MGPFEAFRCSQPAPRVAGQALAGAGAAAAAAGSAPTPPPKRRRSGGSASPAAAPTPQQPAPAGGPPAAGLALEKLGDQPLRLVIVGHNPSDHAW